jgi:hypothetical protein
LGGLGVLLAYQAWSRWLGGGWLLGWLGFLAWGQDGVQRGAFHAGHELDDAGITHVLNEAVDDGVAQLAVGHLPAFEAQRGLYLVAFAQETNCLVLLGLVIMLIHGHGEFHFLDHDDFLLLARCAIALVLFVKELAVILNAADGWLGCGRNFYQVEATLAGYFKSFEGRQNSELFTVFVDDADFTRANSVVNADKRLGRTLIDGFLRKRETQGPSNKA